MILKTYGHATLSLGQGDKPIVITDPWLLGSCYWRSWWLQHYPSDMDLSVLSNTDFIFLTHEHWDHAHFPTLRKYFLNKKYLYQHLIQKDLRIHWKKIFKCKKFHLTSGSILEILYVNSII